MIKLDERKISQGRPCPCRAHNFVARMLTRDLFAVANLLVLFLTYASFSAIDVEYANNHDEISFSLNVNEHLIN